LPARNLKSTYFAATNTQLNTFHHAVTKTTDITTIRLLLRLPILLLKAKWFIPFVDERVGGR